MHLDLTDEEAAALIKELADITGSDRYPFSARIQALSVGPRIVKVVSDSGRSPNEELNGGQEEPSLGARH